MTTAHRPTWDAAVAGTKRGEFSGFLNDHL